MMITTNDSRLLTNNTRTILIIAHLQTKHETICKRFHSRPQDGATHSQANSSFPRQHPQQTYSSKSDDEETDYDNVDQAEPRGSWQHFPGGATGDATRRARWRNKHDDLINNVRSARRAARATRESRSMSPPPASSEHSRTGKFTFVCREYNFCSTQAKRLLLQSIKYTVNLLLFASL